MRWQSDNRSTLNYFEQRSGIVKFYPLLDVTQQERSLFIKEKTQCKNIHILDPYFKRKEFDKIIIRQTSDRSGCFRISLAFKFGYDVHTPPQALANAVCSPLNK